MSSIIGCFHCHKPVAVLPGNVVFRGTAECPECAAKLPDVEELQEKLNGQTALARHRLNALHDAQMEIRQLKQELRDYRVTSARF